MPCNNWSVFCMPASCVQVVPEAESLPRTNTCINTRMGLSCLAACNVRAFGMEALAESSALSCVSAAFWSPVCETAIGASRSVDDKFAITVALISRGYHTGIYMRQSLLRVFISVKSKF